MQKTKRVKDPRKQRKRLFNAPAHMRHKMMAAPLAPELVSRGAKTLPVRKGDTVRVVRGDHIGFEGKVNRVDLKRYRITLEGLTREKVDGTNIFVSIHPSKVMIKSLKLDDKWRKAILENKKQIAAKQEKAVEKVVAKPPRKTKAVKTKEKEEKPVEEKAAVKEKPAEKAPTAKKRVQKKPAAKKEKEEKPVVKKKAPSAAKKAPLEKEKKPKTVKKAPAKRKTAASKKKGGT
jgi:large subunit ribosomal protein L24